MVAKVAAQTAKYYGEAAEALIGDGGAALKGSEQKAWPSVLGWQQKTFEAWAQFHAAAEHEAAHEYGLQVARLAKADEIVAAVGAAQKAGAAPSELQESWADALAVISREHAKAVRHNDTVYTERVPSFATLPTVECKSIVRSLTAPELLPPAAAAAVASAAAGGDAAAAAAAEAAAADAADEEADLFTALVPLSVLSDASVYTARRDDLLRDLDAVATVRMTEDADLASLDLPDALHAAERPADLPEEYLLALDEVRAAGGEEGLREALTALPARARDLESLVMAVEALLEVEEWADNQLHAAHGAKWRALPSAQLNAEATAELATLKGKLAQAAGADGALASQYDAAREGIALLRLSDAELRALLPAGGDVSSLPCTQDVRHLLESLRPARAHATPSSPTRAPSPHATTSRARWYTAARAPAATTRTSSRRRWQSTSRRKPSSTRCSRSRARSWERCARRTTRSRSLGPRTPPPPSSTPSSASSTRRSRRTASSMGRRSRVRSFTRRWRSSSRHSTAASSTWRRRGGSSARS